MEMPIQAEVLRGGLKPAAQRWAAEELQSSHKEKHFQIKKATLRTSHSLSGEGETSQPGTQQDALERSDSELLWQQREPGG